MSLINKVLRDLDARSTSRSDETGSPDAVYQGVRPTGRPVRRFRRVPTRALMLVAVLAVGLYAYLVSGGNIVNGSRWLPGWAGSSSTSGETIASPETGVADTDAGKPVATTQGAPNGVAANPKSAARKSSPKSRRSVISKTGSTGTAAAPRPRSSRAAVKKEVTPLSAAEQAENAYRRGATALDQGNRPTAEKHLKQALQYDAAHHPARELLAGVYLAAGRRAEARAQLEVGLKKTPGQPRLTLLLSRILIDQGRNEEAIAQLEQGMKANPADAQLASLTAAVYQRTQQHQSAVRVYRKALSLRPGEARWWMGLAISLEAESANAEAREAYQRALQTGLDTKLARYAQQRMSVLKDGGNK